MRYAPSLSRMWPGAWRMEWARAEYLLIALSKNYSAARGPMGTPKYAAALTTMNFDAPGTS